jgi:hypothetical protein
MSYADIVERIFGTRARRVSTVLQSVQLVVIVGNIETSRFLPLIPSIGWDNLLGQRSGPRPNSKTPCTLPLISEFQFDTKIMPDLFFGLHRDMGLNWYGHRSDTYT